jgi:anti-sigma regulatory factor (Ser/Thr protein kinase)
MTNGLDLEFKPDPAAVPAVRRAVEACGDIVPQHVLANLGLVASELVTNAIRHGPHEGNAWVRLHVEAMHGAIRLEVDDSGDGFRPPPTGKAADDAEVGAVPESGWGLFLVDRLSRRWGVEGKGGTRVWCELAA